MGLAATSLVVGALALGQSFPGQGPIHSAWARHAQKETLSVAGFVLGAGQTPADPDSGVLVLQVDDRARVPPEVKANARTETLRIFAAAGVRVIWVDGDAWAEAIEGRTLLFVRILDQAATEWLAKKLQLAPEVGGQATP